MNFRNAGLILAVLLAGALIVQPALSAGNVTKIVTNYTSDLENDNATQLFNYGQQSLTLNDFPSALKFYDQALAGNLTMLKKTDALLYLYQGKAYALIQLGNYTDALKTVDAGLALYPNDPLLWNNRGYTLSQTGNLQDALVAYDKALSISKDYTKAYINKGNLLLQMGRYSDAASAFIRANETDPFNIAASDGLMAARAGEAKSGGNIPVIPIIVILVIAAGIAVWYVRFRKPAEPEADEKKKKSKKK